MESVRMIGRVLAAGKKKCNIRWRWEGKVEFEQSNLVPNLSDGKSERFRGLGLHLSLHLCRSGRSLRREQKGKGERRKRLGRSHLRVERSSPATTLEHLKKILNIKRRNKGLYQKRPVRVDTEVFRPIGMKVFLWNWRPHPHCKG